MRGIWPMWLSAFINNSFIRKSIHYGAIGVVGLGINFAVFHLALLDGVSPISSNALAIVISILSNFTIATQTQLLTQRGLRMHALKLMHWALCSLSGILANISVFVGFHPVLGNTGANLLATVTGMGTSYAVAVTTRLWA